jgi:hypothetical protein
VERAIAKMSALGRTAGTRAPIRHPEPAGLDGGAALTLREPARPGARAARGPITSCVDIDARRLARAGMFTPGTTVNRTTEEFRLIKRAVLERADKVPTGLLTPIWSW